MQADRVPYGWILGVALAAVTLVRLGTSTPALFRMAWLAFVVVAQGSHEIGRSSKDEPSGPIRVVAAGVLAILAGFVLLVVDSSDWGGHAGYSRFLMVRGTMIALLILAALFLHARRRGWYREFAPGPVAPDASEGKFDRQCLAGALSGWFCVAGFVAHAAGIVTLRGASLGAWLAASATSVFVSLGCVFAGMGRGGRRRRLAAFAHASFLLATAVLLDLGLAPDFDLH